MRVNLYAFSMTEGNSVIGKIKDKMAVWRDSSPRGRKFFVVVRNIVVQVMSILPDVSYAKWFYRTYTGKKLHLEEPQLLNEKMWWLKLNNRDPLLTKCSDKHLVREYVTECGYADILIPQVGAYDSAEDIDFSKFTEPTILKCNNNSGGHVYYDPKYAEDFNETEARHKLAHELKTNYYLISREWNYKNIPPKIVAEKVIRDKKGNLPSDYRFFCFDGEPRLLMMDIGVMDQQGRYQHVYPRNIYDMDFNLLPVRWGRDNYTGHVDKPQSFERMIEIARKLSQPFPMCRVDLYNLDGNIYFGEITFYHGGCCQQITPEEWDLKMASWIDLDSPKIVRN